MKIRRKVSKKVMTILMVTSILSSSQFSMISQVYSTSSVSAESRSEENTDFEELQSLISEIESYQDDTENYETYLKRGYEEAKKITSSSSSKDIKRNIVYLKNILASYYNIAILIKVYDAAEVNKKLMELDETQVEFKVKQPYKNYFKNEVRGKIAESRGNKQKVIELANEIKKKLDEIDSLIQGKPIEQEESEEYKQLKALLEEVESYQSDTENYNTYLKNTYEEAKKVTNNSPIEDINRNISNLKGVLGSYYNIAILLPVYDRDIINIKLDELDSSQASYKDKQLYKNYFKKDINNKIRDSIGNKEKIIELANEIKIKIKEMDNLIAGRNADDDGIINSIVDVGDLGLNDYPHKESLVQGEKLYRSYKDGDDENNLRVLRGLVNINKKEVEKAKQIQKNTNSFLGAWEYFQEVINKVEGRTITIEGAKATYKKKIQVLREDLIQITAAMEEYKDAYPSTDDEIEAYLKKTDPDIVILSKGTINGYGSQASENAVFSMLHSALATSSDKIEENKNTFRIFKTNKGYRLILTFKGIKRSQPTDDTGIHFNYAHLGKIVDINSTQPSNSIEPVSTYHFYNSQNLPEGMENTGVEGFRGMFNPKEFVMPVEKGEDYFFKVSVAQMGSNAQMGAIRIDWNTLNMASINTMQVLNEEINNALSIEKTTKTQSAFDKMREAVNQVKNNLANIRTEDEVKASIKKVTDAVDEFKNSEDSFLARIAKEMYNQYENLGNLKDSAMERENSRAISNSYNALKKSIKDLQSEEQIRAKIDDVNTKLSNAKYYTYTKTKLSLVNTNGEPIKNESLNYKGKVFKFGGASYLDLKLNNSNIQNLQLYINNEQTDPLSKYRLSLDGENDNDLIEKMSIFNIGTKALKQYYVKYTDKSKQEHTGILKLDDVKLDLTEMNNKHFSIRRISKLQIRKYIESNPTENEEIINSQKDILEKLGKEVKENSYDQEDVNNATTRMHEFLVKLGLEESGDINLPKNTETTEASKPSTTEIEDASKSNLKDGKYIGEGIGFEGGKTVVEVTIKNGKISNIEVKSTEDTDMYFNNAKSIIGKIVKQNGPDNVDVVTNATYSSNGIKRAVSNALEKSKKASEEEATTNPSSTGEGTLVTPSTNNGNPVDSVDDESGIYNARIKKYTDDSDSMANGSLNNKEVKIEKLPNGKYKYTLKFNPVHLSNDEGNITNLFVLLDGKHQATKNNDGTWSFVLDENSKRIEIAVWVDIMDAISSAGSDHVIPGKGEQKAILIISDKKENTSPPTTGVVPPTTGVVPPTTGVVPPTTGVVPPTTGVVPPTTGVVPPTTGVVPPTTGVVPPTPSSVKENKEIYSVPARILNYNENKPSMANASLSSQSILVEKVDNGYKYTVKLSPMKIQNMEGHINNLFILTPNSKIAANKEENNNWSFVLPDKSDEVTIAVWVDAMDELASIGGPVIPGKGEQKARLELDWSRMSSINEKQANNIKNETSSAVKSNLNPMLNNKLENLQNTEAAVSSVQYEEVSLTANATPEERKELDIRNIKEAKNISGQDRYKTSIEISKKYFKTADDVVLVSGQNNSDAMISSTVSKAHNAPILLADSGKDEFLKEIERLKATKVTIVGGEASIPESIKDELTKRNITVTRLAGKDRYDTSLKVAAYLSERNSMNNAVLVNGRSESDALSVSGLATKEDAPIILVRKQGLTDSDKKELDGLNLNSVYAIGGEKSISKDILQEVNAKNKDRISGKNRYETSLKIAEKVSNNPENIILVSGENSVDALSAGAIAFKTSSPVLLVGKDLDHGLKSMIKKGKKKNVILLGGEKTISKKIKDFFRGR